MANWKRALLSLAWLIFIALGVAIAAGMVSRADLAGAKPSQSRGKTILLLIRGIVEKWGEMPAGLVLIGLGFIALVATWSLGRKKPAPRRRKA
ncbi:MAG: hypothetical protein H6811_08410 [Phycisphaeraceae bacterium]|nr:hypothetical protein [Phycisphaeraceae bacterium]